MNNNLIPENYNSKDLVSMWREFIDWDKRRIGEGNFLVDLFHKHGVKNVFDASLGDGCDSIYLIKQGFDVTSNEIDQTFLEKALENAKQENVELKMKTLDWRNLDSELPEESFDTVICLGNSLTYLFTGEDQSKTFCQFKRILRSGGILIVDERNYQYILDNRKKILEGDFCYSGRYVYCGDKVHGKPIEILDGKVKFEYESKETKKKGYLTLYPFKSGEMRSLLAKAGFKSIEQFSDYRKVGNHSADFYQYVCR